MYLTVSNVPSHIDVDGKTYPLSYRNQRYFAAQMNQKSDPDYVTSQNLAELPDKVRAWERDAAVEREYQREIRAEKKAKEKAPTVWALLRTEKVAVRGWSERGRRKYSSKDTLLITRADGRKQSVSPWELTPLGLDQEALEKAQEANKEAQARKSAIANLGGLGDVLHRMRRERLEVIYNPETTNFDASFVKGEGDEAVTLSVSGVSVVAVQDHLQLLYIANERPFFVTSGEDGYRIIPTEKRENTNFYSYDYAFSSEELAQQYIDAVEAASEAAQALAGTKRRFDYDAEVERVRAALAVVNGESK